MDLDNIILSETAYTFVTGWYGVCGELLDGACQPFDLRTISSDLLFKVVQVAQNGKSRVSFNPSLPPTIPQPFTKLECGFLYEITFKPSETVNFKIKDFVPIKQGEGSDFRITNTCLGKEVHSTPYVCKQDPTAYTFVSGFVGYCTYGGDEMCQSYNLRNLPQGMVFKVLQIAKNGISRASFNPQLPSTIPQPFTTLECGYIYEFTINPGSGEFDIPNFVSSNNGGVDNGRLIDMCIIHDPTPTPTPTPAKTTTTQAVSKGDTILQISTEDQDKFLVGQGIVIDEGTEIEEYNRIKEFGSIILETPLRYDHGTNATISHVTEEKYPTPTPTPNPVPLVDFINATDTSITVEWTLIGSKQELVKIDLYDASETTKLNTETKGNDISEYTFGNLLPATTYVVKIAAVDDGQTGEFVELPVSTTIPGNYGSFAITLTSENKPLIKYTAPENAVNWNSVNILRKVGTTMQIIATVPRSTNSKDFDFTDTSVSSDGTYQYKIQFNNKFLGSASDIKSIVIDTTPAGVPAPTTLTPTNNNTPEWTWNPVTGASTYRIKLNNQAMGDNPALKFKATTLSDGNHTIEVASVDSAGNISAFGKHTVLIDTKPPSVPVVSTSSNLTNNSTPTWTWNANTDVKTYGIKLDNDDEIFRNATSFTSPRSLTDGTYTLKVRASDDLGNWSAYGTSSVVVDVTKPTTPNPTSQTPTSNSKPTWTWPKISDAVQYGVKLNNNAEVLITAQENPSYTSPQELDTGFHSINVRAKDKAGNWSNVGTHVVEVDKVAPVAPVPSTTTPTNNKRPTWTWPPVSTANQYIVSFNGGNEVSVGNTNSYTPTQDLSTGSYTLSVYAKDAVGNKSPKGSHTVTIDLELPPIPQPSTTSPTNNKQPKWTWNPVPDADQYIVVLDNNSPATVNDTSYIPPVPLSEGTHTIKVKAKDKVGNLSNDYGVHSVVIDTTPPAVPVVTTTSSLTNSARPIWSWGKSSDAFKFGVVLDSNPETIQDSNSFSPSTNLSDGSHTLKVRVRDSVGNWSNYGSKTITVDTTPPSKPSITAPSKTRDRTPSFKWTSTGNPVQYEVTFNNKTIMQTNNDYTSDSELNNGNYNLNVRAKDQAGNWSQTASHSVEVYCIPSDFEKFTIQGNSYDTSGQQKGKTSLMGFQSGSIFGIKSSEFSNGISAMVDSYIENNFAGMIVFTQIEPRTSTKLYLQIDNNCYEAEIGPAQYKDTHYVINFTKIST